MLSNRWTRRGGRSPEQWLKITESEASVHHEDENQDNTVRTHVPKWIKVHITAKLSSQCGSQHSSSRDESGQSQFNELRNKDEKFTISIRSPQTGRNSTIKRKIDNEDKGGQSGQAAGYRALQMQVTFMDSDKKQQQQQQQQNTKRGQTVVRQGGRWEGRRGGGE